MSEYKFDYLRIESDIKMFTDYYLELKNNSKPNLAQLSKQTNLLVSDMSFEANYRG